MSFYKTITESFRDAGARAGIVLDDVIRRRMAGEAEPVPEPERFDFAKPPPGHYWDLNHPGYVRQGHGKLRLLADAWARWKLKRNPPGSRETSDALKRAQAWAAYESRRVRC